MVANRIKVLRAEAKISAAELAEAIGSGLDKVVMSYIERGKVLPTKSDLKAICDYFGVEPEAIYTPDDLDLTQLCRTVIPAEATPQEVDAAVTPTFPKAQISVSCEESEPQKVGGANHDGMEQLRVWMGADEKNALFKAVGGLGYNSVAEWLREMYRDTVHRYLALGLKEDQKLHDAAPPRRIESFSEPLITS